MKRTPLKRKSPIRQRSKKKNSELAKRRKLKQSLIFQRGPNCEAKTPACSGSAHEMHETLLRSQGGSAVDEENILLVCRSCHTYIHNNPAESYEKGWLKHSWEES